MIYIFFLLHIFLTDNYSSQLGLVLYVEIMLSKWMEDAHTLLIFGPNVF